MEKSKSPKIKCKLNESVFSALIDSGAEINAFDEEFALQLKIGMQFTNESACAAKNSS